MDSSMAILALAALAQDTRLGAFKLLVKHEPDGMAAGELARLLKVPQNTLSTHLALLSQAGLATSERHSRSIIYRARLEGLREVVLYLLRDCCDGNTALCAPIISDLTLTCSTAECCP
ncbi:MAG: metalloregulator ArsR/SmtB family transcription factor [Aestuariivirga sp.]